MAGLTEEEELELLELEEAEAQELLPEIPATDSDIPEQIAGNIGAFAESIRPPEFMAKPIEEGAVRAASFLTGSDPEQALKERLAQREARAEEYPVASALGEASGDIITPFSKAKGLTGAALRTGQAGLMGAAHGEDTEEAKDIGGTAAGATALLEAAGPIGRGISKVAGPKAVRGALEKTAKSALGLDKGALRTKLRKMDPSGNKAIETARFAKEKGILRSGATSGKMLDKTLDVQDKIGKELGDVINTGAPIDIKSTVSKLRAAAEDSAANLDDITAKHIHDYADKLENLTTTAPASGSRLMGPTRAKTSITPEELKQLKTKLGKQVKDFTKDSDIIEARKSSYGILSDTIEESLSPAQRDKLRKLNEEYTKTTHLKEGLTGKVDTDESADLFGWQNMMLGTAHPAAPVARELIRSYGKSFATIGVRKPNTVLKNSKWADAFQKATEKSGAGGVAAAHYQLMQTDEDYRKAVKKQKENE